jgi:outer membrane scaffolding protein for murein synthesis (MipA/OmpV family)
MKFTRFFLQASLGSMLWISNSGAQAQSSTGLPLWELGVFGVGVSQQAYPGSDQQVARGLALPYLIYRGEFLRADRETAGLRAVKTPRFELDIGVAGSFGSRSNDIEARQGMPDLGTLVEFGPRIKWNLLETNAGGRLRLELPLRGVFDLEADAAHRGMAFEPKLVFQRRAPSGWDYSAGLSAIFADQRLARTFYAVDPMFAAPGREAYEAASGLVTWRLSASFSRNVSQDWRIFGFGRIDSMNGSANKDSPLVRRTNGLSVGVGFAYTWMRSQRMAKD